MVDVDLNTLIGTLAVVVTGICVGVAYIVKLSMRVHNLEKELERNPILNILKQFEEKNIINVINAFVSSRLEK